MAKLTELNANTTRTACCSWAPGLVFFTLGTIALAMLVVQLDTFETVAYPMHELGESMLVAARKNAGSLPGVEKIGNGQLIGAEDIVYEPKSGVVYTGCHDGWIKRVTLNDSVADSVVENWVHTGGRPLGLAIDQFGDVFVADAYKVLTWLYIFHSTKILKFYGCLLFSFRCFWGNFIFSSLTSSFSDIFLPLE